MKAAVLLGPQDLRLRDENVPEFREDEVLIRVRAVGICGSDVECYAGRSIEGIFPYIPGHEWSGEVVDVGIATTTFKKGDRVVGETLDGCGICDNCKVGRHAALCRNPRVYGFQPATPGAFAEYTVRRERSLLKLPSNLTYEEGALVEPFSVAYYGVWTVGGGVQPTDNVAVFGAGPIGLFAIAAAKASGARVISIDPIAKRREIAATLGADIMIDPAQKDATKEILSSTGGFGVDMAIEASGSAEAASRIFDVVDNGGTIVLIGNSFGKTIPMELWKAIMKGLTVGTVAGYSFPPVLDLMSDRKVDVTPIITHRFPLESAAEAFQLAAKRTESIKIIVLP